MTCIRYIVKAIHRPRHSSILKLSRRRRRRRKTVVPRIQKNPPRQTCQLPLPRKPGTHTSSLPPLPPHPPLTTRPTHPGVSPQTPLTPPPSPTSYTPPKQCNTPKPPAQRAAICGRHDREVERETRFTGMRWGLRRAFLWRLSMGGRFMLRSGGIGGVIFLTWDLGWRMRGGWRRIGK